MGRGRRPDARGTIARLPGDAAAKRELATILATLTGDTTVEQACAALGIGAARFFQLREQALAGALVALTPKAAGRPPREEPAPEASAALQARIAALEDEVQAALVRTEIALAMPHLLRPEKKRKRGAARVAPLAPAPRPRGGDHDGP